MSNLLFFNDPNNFGETSKSTFHHVLFGNGDSKFQFHRLE